MRKNCKILSLILAIVVLFSCTACTDFSWIISGDGGTTKYEVTFVYNNGQDNKTVSVDNESKIAEPTAPEKESYIFIGWFTDAKFKNEYDFDNVVNKDLTLYAKFEENLDAINGEKFQVTFVLNNGETEVVQEVLGGKPMQTPLDPVKVNGIFTGWYTDGNFTDKYDFSKVVTKNLTLYAKYEIDAVAITNEISNKVMKSVVKIYLVRDGYKVELGSGFCFKTDGNRYYILTNCHVAKKMLNTDTYIIEDYKGNEYDGYLVNSGTSSDAISAEYDLACLYFNSNETEVEKLSLASTNPKVGSDVISLGSPNGQTNYIAFGKIKEYTKVTLEGDTTESNVTFDVISHSARIDEGASGGPLLDENLKVVGVNYAVGFREVAPEEYEFASTYTVPILKVKEFLASAFPWTGFY